MKFGYLGFGCPLWPYEKIQGCQVMLLREEYRVHAAKCVIHIKFHASLVVIEVAFETCLGEGLTHLFQVGLEARNLDLQ